MSKDYNSMGQKRETAEEFERRRVGVLKVSRDEY